MSFRFHTFSPKNCLSALQNLTPGSTRLTARQCAYACVLALLLPLSARAQDTNANIDQGIITSEGVINTEDSPTQGARSLAAPHGVRSLSASHTRSTTPDTSGALLGEFRSRGSGGALDEYIELANSTTNPLNIGGWSVKYLSGGALVSATVPTGTSLPPLGHYLFTGSGYNSTLLGISGSDQSLSSPMDDATGITLLNAAASVVDAVSFAGSSMAGEGTLLPSAPTDNGEYAFERRQSSGSPAGVPLDNNYNVGDFIFVSTTGATFASVTGGGTSGTLDSTLGAPSPDSTTGFLQRADVALSLFDTAVSNSASPNRVRLNGTVDNGVGTPDRYGTLRLRRTLTNTGTGTITRIRFHIVTITTYSAGGNGGYSDLTQADVRVLTSPDETGIATSTGAKNVIGTSVQAPSTGGYGGGLNANAVVLNQALAPGASANYSFELGVARKGNFLAGFTVEELADTAPPSAPTLTGTAGNAAALLSWTTPTSATGFKLFRSTTSGVYGTAVQSFGVSDTHYTDSPLVNGTTYYYRLVATGAGGDSATSNEVVVTPTAPLDARVRVGTGGAWIGEATLDATGQSEVAAQIADAGTTATFFVSVQRPSAATGQSARLKVLGYADFVAAGGVANFFVGTSGNIIPSTITSAGGWSVNIAPGQESLVRVEVSGPAGAAAGSSQSLVLQAQDGDSGAPPISDAVTLTTVVPAIHLTATRGDFTGALNNISFQLSWTSLPGAASYSVQRTPENLSDPWSTIATGVTDTRYLDCGHNNQVILDYKVVALDAQGAQIGVSNTVEVSADFTLDARIRRSTTTSWVGNNIINETGQDQEVSQYLTTDEVATYFISVHRFATNGAGSNGIHFTAPGFGAFTQAGGHAHFFVGTTPRDITTAITSAQGWTSTDDNGDPINIAVGEDFVVRLEMRVTPAEEEDLTRSLLIKCQGWSTQESLPDAVVATETVEALSTSSPFLDHIEWSRDGVNWQTVSGSLPLLHNQSIGLRAVARDPINHPWEDNLNYVPTWSLLDPGSTQARRLIGEMVWIPAKDIGTLTFSATAGGTLGGTLSVSPDPTEDDNP